MADDAPIVRAAARVVLLDESDRILLLKALGDFADGTELWLTPGGALERGESHEAAALRELWEETGIRPEALGLLVWMRTHVFPWDGRAYKQQERYFVARCEAPEVTFANHDSVERDVLTEWRWWTAAEIRQSDAVFVPRRLGELLPQILAGDYPVEPIPLGM